MNKICLVGDILLDVSLQSNENPSESRLGGVVHAARCLWALGVDYSIGYFAPSYLDSHIRNYLMSELGCSELHHLGEVTDCPYTMLIKDVKGCSDRDRELILRDKLTIKYDEEELNKLGAYADLFFIQGNYDFQKILSVLSIETRVHCDISNNMVDFHAMADGRKYETLFLSTSSSWFKKQFTTIEILFETFKPLTSNIVLKENRGGSRASDYSDRGMIQVPAQIQPIAHSVGVGDVYDAAVVALKNNRFTLEQAMYYAAWIAMEYAKTTSADEFSQMVQRILKTPVSDLISLGGCCLPWEKRSDCHIYVAAPDFNFVDVAPIDRLVEILSHYNFIGHRPIKENGQMSPNPTFSEKQSIFAKDMQLLDKCNMVVAVMLYDDPGTLIEIGLAAERKIPTIVYDPYKTAKNCMLTQLPDFISSDIDEVIAHVYLLYGRPK